MSLTSVEVEREKLLEAQLVLADFIPPFDVARKEPLEAELVLPRFVPLVNVEREDSPEAELVLGDFIVEREPEELLEADLVLPDFIPLKPRLPDLPTVSKSFFFKGPRSHLHKLRAHKPSYIFFSPALKLSPHLITYQDFVTPPSTTLLCEDIEDNNKNSTIPFTPPNRQELKKYSAKTSSAEQSSATKSSAKSSAKKSSAEQLSDVNMAKSSFDHIDKDFETVKAIKDKATLIDADFKRVTKVILEFIKENEEECNKVPRTWKKQNWKDLCTKFVDDEGNGQEFWNSDREGFTSSDDLVYPKDKISISFLVCMILKRECTKHFSNLKRKSNTTADDDEDTSPNKKSKTTPKSTGKAAKGSSEAPSSVTPKTTKKRAPAKRTKKAAPPKTAERVGDDESGSEEEDLPEDANPFEAAQHANYNPAFARENLIGKPGIPATPTEAAAPVVEAPHIVTETHITNEYFSFSSISPARKADGLDPEEFDIEGEADLSAIPGGIRHSVEDVERLSTIPESESEMLDDAQNGGISNAPNLSSGFNLSSPTWQPSTPMESPMSPLTSIQNRQLTRGNITPDWNTEAYHHNGNLVSFEMDKKRQEMASQAIAVGGVDKMMTTQNSAAKDVVMIFNVSVATGAAQPSPSYMVRLPVNTPFIAAFGQILGSLMANPIGPVVLNAITATLSWSGHKQTLGIKAPDTETHWKAAIDSITGAMEEGGHVIEGNTVDLIFS